MLDKNSISTWFKTLQLSIINDLEQCDKKGKFEFDNWERPEGGGGKSSVMENGAVIEKGGVNFSEVYGPTPEFLIRTNPSLAGTQFYATGVSIVLHPHNPQVPIIHMNVRYFEAGDSVYWFGGGIDLTPHYINKEDANYFHNALKEVCNKHDTSFYPKYKEWADNYFYIPHRKETRGIGGIFFDHISGKNEAEKEDIFEFVMDVGSSFAPIYTHFMRKNSGLDFTAEHKQWQHLRRGRYVEFNLVNDKGTKFGLETNGRTESILMSLPPLAEWKYNYIPLAGSKEAETLSLLKKGIDWTAE